MYKKKNKIIKVANIIEEPRIGGPQLRLLSIASALRGKIDVTIIFPIKNSKNFQAYCKEFNVKYLLSPITTLHRNWLKIFLYICFINKLYQINFETHRVLLSYEIESKMTLFRIIFFICAEYFG